MTAATEPVTPPRDVWVSVGLGVAAVSAAFSSFDGLRSLAIESGWSQFMAPLFALCIDAYALAAIRVWLTRSTSPRAARFARHNAIGAVILSLLGNAAFHLINAKLVPVTWVIVMLVGSVPPVILGLVTHLSVLRRQVDRPMPTNEAMPSPAPLLQPVRPPGRPEDGLDGGQQADLTVKDGGMADRPAGDAQLPAASSRKRSRAKATRRTPSEAELLVLGRQADATYRERYGRGISRDALRAALKVGGTKASAVLHQLRAEQDVDHAEVVEARG